MQLKTLFGIGAVCLFAMTGQARAASYGTAGCGLGALIFKDEPGKIQILVATINNLISPQTSAITSGTSGCWEEDQRSAAQSFIEVNQITLRKEISQGNGETVASLSRFYRCSDANQFGAKMQQNYERIFPTDKAKATDIDHSIINTIKNDSALAQSCKVVG